MGRRRPVAGAPPIFVGLALGARIGWARRCGGRLTCGMHKPGAARNGLRYLQAEAMLCELAAHAPRRLHWVAISARAPDECAALRDACEAWCEAWRVPCVAVSEVGLRCYGMRPTEREPMKRARMTLDFASVAIAPLFRSVEHERRTINQSA